MNDTLIEKLEKDNYEVDLNKNGLEIIKYTVNAITHKTSSPDLTGDPNGVVTTKSEGSLIVSGIKTDFFDYFEILELI